MKEGEIMNKEKYIVPELEIIHMQEEDVITTSNGGGVDEMEEGNPFGQ